MVHPDCILTQGSNMAECPPVAFQWVVEAKQRGAKVIHVDPRFTRTSALADLHVPIRAGSDIVFLGALVNHVIANQRSFREYVVRYTNAPMIIDEGFADTEDLDGLFGGFDPGKAAYDDATWQYAGVPDLEHAEGEHESETGQQFGGVGHPAPRNQPPAERNPPPPPRRGPLQRQ